MKLRMSDADRVLYGGPEWLDWDPGRFTVSEAEAFQAHVRDEAGNPVPIAKYSAWLDTPGLPQTKWALWAALRRAGHEVAWDMLDPDLLDLQAVRDEPAPAAATVEGAGGKAKGGRSTQPRRSASAEKPSPQP